MENKIRKVLVAAPVHPVLIDGLVVAGYQCVVEEKITQDLAMSMVGDCVGIITSTRLQIDKSLLDAAPMLQWVGRMGSGMEIIDVAYATAKGIKCYSSPEGNSNAVGEHALGMLLSLIRNISWSHAEVHSGVWKRDENRGAELEGKTLAIIGYGHTGAAFARKLLGFDMRILAYDKYNSASIPPNIEACGTLDEIFAQADIVSFHVPLSDDTVGYLNADFIASMKKSFILINTSRGKVVDTIALLNGLQSGKISGACLDVFEHEPVTTATGALQKAVTELMQMPGVIVTPHIAGYTFEALYKMSAVLLSKITH